MGEVSVKDVAARAGVSLGTVSNVLNRPDKVRKGTRERVQAAIDELGFVRNDAARQLREGVSRTVGLIVLDSSNPFFMELARGAEKEALAHGHTLLLGNSDNSPEQEKGYLDLFEQQRVAGILITPAHADAEQVTAYARRGLRTVLVDRAPDAASMLDAVSVDGEEGGILAVRHLLGSGRRRVVFLAGPLNIKQVQNRLRGARAAVAEVPGAELSVAEAVDMTIAEGHRLIAALMELPADERPDAVFATNDLLAIGAMRAINATGHSHVPEDVAVVGYDDIPYAEMLQVPLTSVRQPAAQIGAAAVAMLLGPPQDQPRHTVFHPELVVRASTSPRG